MAATSTLDRVDKFDGTKDDRLQYVERLKHFFTANGNDDTAKKWAVLLLVVGATTYKILRCIISPSKLGEKSYMELVEALSKYFKPTPSKIVEHFKFHFRVRRAAKLITNYVTELPSLSEC